MNAPPELVELQGFLQAALRREHPIAGDADAERSAGLHVAGNARLTPAAQADIYREQFWLRHREALSEDYVGLGALLGQEAFEAFLNAYLTACPPKSPSLRDLGDRIVPFAQSYEGFAPDLRAIVLEMVRYENTIVDVFDGAEPPPLDAAKLASLDEEAWDRACIVLHPLLFLLKLDYPVHTYRIAAKVALDEHGGHCVSCDGAPSSPALPEARRVWLGLFRSDLVVSYEELTEEGFQLLSALRAGDSLPRACDRVARGLDEDAAALLMERVGGWFQQWTTWRWIIDISL